ncbi:PrsW family glutamic-type intramembrane protease [Fodinicola acaciae]|uniref:PrsW family glutamic-type intramembrane protease n=1 Tax=Fodinicola acaciae TaxID=2681555 RepID=UPI0013D2CE19|nr:PrsW family glutamic-type intramembrane protease [Fodinicola acaciae]
MATSLVVAGVGVLAGGKGGGIARVFVAILFLVGLVTIGVLATAGISQFVVKDARTRYRSLAIAAAVGGGITVLLLGVVWLLDVAGSPAGYALSLPTVAAGLWACRRIRTNRPPAWWLVLLALVWGAVVATSIALLVETVFADVLDVVDLPAIIGRTLSPAIVEEFCKGCGVLILMTVFPRRLHGMVAGLVIGTVVGLGFQSAEALGYMHGGLDTMLYQYWYRLSAGLALGHASYTALTGAGIGLASQQRSVSARICCTLGGLVAAVTAHLIWNTAVAFDLLWTPDIPALYLFVAIPLTLLVFKGPALVLVATLAIVGNRRETRTVAAELAAEAAAEDEDRAVFPDELASLGSPSRRKQIRLRTLIRAGWDAYRRLARLHRLQIDLALTRWYRREGAVALPADAETRLRRAAYAIRHGKPAPPPVFPPVPQPQPDADPPGPSLARVIATEGPRPAAVVRAWAVPLAGALADLHRTGVVHGGLTPSTVRVAAGGPVLADAAVQKASSPASLRYAAAITGHTSFLSPQLRKGQSATAADDMYALGAVLFFAVTGRGPGAGLDGVTDPALRQLISDCLDEDPARRPAAAAVADRLAVTPSATPVSTLPSSGAPVRAATWWAVGIGAVAVLAVLAVVLVVGTAAVTYRYASAGSSRTTGEPTSTPTTDEPEPTDSPSTSLADLKSPCDVPDTSTVDDFDMTYLKSDSGSGWRLCGWTAYPDGESEDKAGLAVEYQDHAPATDGFTSVSVAGVSDATERRGLDGYDNGCQVQWPTSYGTAVVTAIFPESSEKDSCALAERFAGAVSTGMPG